MRWSDYSSAQKWAINILIVIAGILLIVGFSIQKVNFTAFVVLTSIGGFMFVLLTIIMLVFDWMIRKDGSNKRTW